MMNDELILVARLLLATLFLIFGWRKLRDYSGAVSQMVQDGLLCRQPARRDLVRPRRLLAGRPGVALIPFGFPGESPTRS